MAFAEDFLARDCRDLAAPICGEAYLGLIEPELPGIAVLAHVKAGNQSAYQPRPFTPRKISRKLT
jgi:hypothetical protein